MHPAIAGYCYKLSPIVSFHSSFQKGVCVCVRTHTFNVYDCVGVYVEAGSGHLDLPQLFATLFLRQFLKLNLDLVDYIIWASSSP